MSKRILVTGAHGQLGQELQGLAVAHPDDRFDFVTRAVFDLEDELQMRDYLEQTQPDYLINCAAYTAVDRAESEPEKADIINHKAVGFLAGWCAKNSCRFLHISTDYVFDGASAKPYQETDVTHPQSIYGLTKLKGEQAAQAMNPDVIIIRTAWVYSEFGNNFVKTMLRLMQERDTLNIVKDQVGSPTYAADLAQAILKIVYNVNWIPGIYHYSNTGRISWFDFAQTIKNVAQLDCELHSIPTTSYPTPASRPAYSLLDTKKIQKIYTVSIPDYESSLIRCLNQLNAQ
ncbi:dTDP-4-dehydrorhamnose reductase [Leeuwenhoekiella polynyae]|uniref:dTDP-4-dehydrorhamnose reductase n=1 Tax=Leeuwenhoekiella polynyae TaxID=1550906 RepID=A0A4Q0NUD0_9FLAO|nr:dTDP-4-dehydrorhamnose reductase [Leeuwenhoekiella polynyae]RXG14694.1 dTDP-4-dehydrorhamnose reductase [Leeuwenhoekiella polynyae]